ncbi:MAG: ABC transporter permease [Kiritimatiellae bacterium]|nr:ABC transporter permease [Kiritimatiellia bacterium]
MNRIRTIFIKEVRQIRRDLLSLGLLIFVPAFLLLLYGYALSFDVKHLRVAVLDEDLSAESRFFQDNLFQNPYFERVGILAARSEIDDWLKRGRARIVLVIPRDFAERIACGKRAVVQALLDGSDATAANVAIGYLDALAEKTSSQLCRKDRMDKAVPPAGGTVKLEPRIWFNPDLQSAHFLIPGLMGMLLMISAVIAASLSIVREKERETIEQINLSAVRPFELILGKILPYLLICLVTTLTVLGVGWLVFGVAVRGSFFLLAVSILIFLFAALGMGLLISASTHSQQEAFQLAVVTTLLPSIILSGLIFPIAAMPRLIQGISLLVVPRYFVAAMRSIILKDASFSIVWPQLAAMIALGLAFNFLAMRLMAKNR